MIDTFLYLEAVRDFLGVVDEAEGEAGVGDGVRDAGELDAVPGAGAPDLLGAVPDEHLGVAGRVHGHHDGARRGVGGALPRRQRPVPPLHVVDAQPHLREQRVGRVVEPLPRHATASAVRDHQVSAVHDPGRGARQLGRRRDRPHNGRVPRYNGERARGRHGERGVGVVRDVAGERVLAVGDPDDGADRDLVVPDADVGAVGARRGEEAEHEVGVAARDQRLVRGERAAGHDCVPGTAAAREHHDDDEEQQVAAER
ncbi:Os01g0784725, partial [Oryza sativa Japonica Group]